MGDTVTHTVVPPADSALRLSESQESEDDDDTQLQRLPHGQGHIPSYAESRMSSSSKRSRPQSTATMPTQSSLSYAQVRDFAYPDFHPMHFGGPAEDLADESTTQAEPNAGRRMSDSVEGSTGSGRGTWSAGPWGGDGAMYGDPVQDMEPLPSTSFGNTDDRGVGETSLKQGRHRKSRSFADVPDYERGRRRESANHTNTEFDPAGRDALRQSRGFQQENGEYRRDSHLIAGAALPSRSYHTSQPIDLDEEIPLDSEPSTHSPQRESIGPEDEELFAGPSLALYSFEPENDNELRLTEGQTIMVSYRHGQGWLVAENPQTGEQGLVPEQYVRLLRDIDGWDEERGGFVDDEELLDDVDEVGVDHNGGVPLVHSSVLKEETSDITKPADHALDHGMNMNKLSMHEE